MKVSLKWLKEYVPLPADVKTLCGRLTLAGLEVESVESPAEALRGVVVAQIRQADPHPNADKLQVTRVDAGERGTLQVVCGAKNFKVGDKVPLATSGTRLPNGVEIKVAPLRGVESHGMLCSARELGLSEDAAGLLILDPNAKVGAPIAEALGQDDVVVTLGVTPNRGDALSHLGIAREVAALTGKSFKRPEIKLNEANTAASSKIKVRVDAPDRCLRYAGRVIDGVKVGPSPSWLADRLKACGVRSINNVVDVTNYVLLEYGQPLHGFDLDKLRGPEIVVRTAQKGEKLVTLDEKERALDADDLLICDKEKPQVIAGVMGGAESEVSPATTRVFLEAARFAPGSIRRSAKRHALHTESSHRFERGVDIDTLPEALDRAAALIAELGGGSVLKGRVDAYPQPVKARQIGLKWAQIDSLLGVEVPRAEARAVLASLGFGVGEEKAGEVSVTVPSWRPDVERAEDLIEEVARIRGFASIPSVPFQRGIAISQLPPALEAERRVRQALSAAGFDEVINYSFVGPEELETLGKKGAVVVRNPLSVEHSVMRTSLAAGLLQNLSRNLRHQVDSVRLYEIGRTYDADTAGGGRNRPVAVESLRIAGVLQGRRHARGWTAKEEAVDFFDAKGAVEAVLGVLGVDGVSFEPADEMPYHPRATARVVRAGKALGLVGELHPKVAKKLDLPGGVFLFDLDAVALTEAAVSVPQFRALPKFPAVLRDIAVVVPLPQTSEDVRKVILEVGGALVEEATLFDVYVGKPVPEGKKNLAYGLKYRAADRTLTDVEVNQAHQRIVEEVNKRLGAALRV